jgi:hypothetical protein
VIPLRARSDQCAGPDGASVASCSNRGSNSALGCSAVVIAADGNLIRAHGPFLDRIL